MSSKLSWNLKLLYDGDDDSKMEKDLRSAERKCKAFAKKWRENKDYLKSPKVMKEALDDYEDLRANYGTSRDVSYYWGLKSALEQGNTKIQAEVNKVHDREVKIVNELEFFELEIGKVEPSIQKKMLSYKGLSVYRHFLERIFETAKYDLTEKEEQLINRLSKTSYTNWVQMTDRFLSEEEREVIDEDGKKRKKTIEEISELMNSQKKKVRKYAAEKFVDINEKHAEAAEIEINSILDFKKQNDEMRGYKRPDSARHIAGDIDTEVVDAMTEAVANSFDLSRRFYRLKVGLLGQKKITYHERVVRYGKISKKYSFDKAVATVQKTLSGLDPEFSKILDYFFRNGQFDVMPQKGKSGGASCIHGRITSPVYILLNYTGMFNDILTLGHEVGHGINNEFMRKQQNALSFGTPLSIAEVSSTFFEDFVLQQLLEGADEEMKLTVMVQKLQDDISSIFRQVAAYRFEQELHETFKEKGYLSHKDIGKLFIKHMRLYMGKYVEFPPGSEYMWVYWGHFRRFFYVYSYASGLLISKALQGMVREDKKAIDKVKEMLSAGTSASPYNIFKDMGIDIKNSGFWNKGLTEVEGLLKETEKLAETLGKV